MASGHDVNKPRTEVTHQTRRQVGREYWAARNREAELYPATTLNQLQPPLEQSEQHIGEGRQPETGRRRNY